MRKYAVLGVTAATVVAFTGCAKIEQKPENLIYSVATQTTQVSSEDTAEAQQGMNLAEQHNTVALEVPEITRQDAAMVLEAEDTAVPEGSEVLVMPRLGYSGTGYVGGLSADAGMSLTVEAQIPATQHYDITIVAGSENASSCRLLANGEPVYTFGIDTTENFVRITIQGIFLNAGACALEIEPLSGTVDIDCVELVNNTSLYDESAALDTVPVDVEASPAAKELYQFFYDQYGKKLITGQYVSDDTNAELEQIYTVTGAYPLIRFDDLGRELRGEGTSIEQSLNWAQQGGIVGLCWYWDAPADVPSVYTKETAFSLADVMTQEDVALASEEELATMAEEGTITQGCYAMIQDIDAAAEALSSLADADVAVLWRPLMEASGDWYWWGASGADPYRWLWNLMYTRMTQYHALHNLIWVWNGQSDEYQIDETQYDIASLDLYVDLDESFGSRYEQYVALRNMVPGKMLALSECSTVPDMSAMFRDNAVWSFFGLFYAQYLEEYTTDAQLMEVYHSEASLTLGDYVT